MKKVSAGILVAMAFFGMASTIRAQQAPAAPREKFSVNQAAERIPNLDTVKRQLREYQACTCDCGCYARDLDRQADSAIAFLRQRAARRGEGEKLAMVLDIDETTLSNFEEMLKTDFAYNNDVFNAWVASAQAPAILGTLRLYQEARNLGVTVFFITGRSEKQRAATEKNLRAEHFDGWSREQLIMRDPETEAGLTAQEYKTRHRAELAEKKYVLILNVGDQWSDLKGVPEAEFSVKYPDPYYFLP